MNLVSLRAELAALRGNPASWRERKTLHGPQGVHVNLEGRDFLSFASNDYLGLANHPVVSLAARHALEMCGVGAGASHLLSGHHELHQRAESDLANFIGVPDALLFSTGYMANLAVVGSLMGRDDAVFSDRLNHASLVDAVLLSRAEHKRYRHVDLNHLEDLLRTSRARSRLIVSDAVFSMDGDIAPVSSLLDLAERYDAWLYIDDAHGFGVLGAHGRGVLEHFELAMGGHERLIYMATLGKAMGVSGAVVAAVPEVVEWLVNKGRSYIYTTAMPPALAAAVSASLRVCREEPWRREKLNRHVARLQSGLTPQTWLLSASETAIQPIIIGADAEAKAISDALYERGIYAPMIRPPTVPKGTSRLRLSLSSAHSDKDIDSLMGNLRELARV
jgi:8-amino-7-oxononanoate synthase